MTRGVRRWGDLGWDRPCRHGGVEIRARLRARLTGQHTPPYSRSLFPRQGCGDVRCGSFLLPLVTLFIFNSPPSCSDMTPPRKTSPGALPAPVSPVPPL